MSEIVCMAASLHPTYKLVLLSGTEFTVTLSDLSSSAKILFKHPQWFDTGVYEVQTPVSDQAMKVFVTHMERKPYELDEIIAHDVKLLCDEFDDEGFGREVLKWLEEHPKANTRYQVHVKLEDVNQNFRELECQIDELAVAWNGLRSDLERHAREEAITAIHRAMEDHMKDVKKEMLDIRTQVAGVRMQISEKDRELDDCRNEISQLRKEIATLPTYRPVLEARFQGKPLHGLFAKMRDLGNGSVTHYVDIWAREAQDGHPASVLVDGDATTFYASSDSAYPWVIFDMKDKRLELTHYSLQSAPYVPERGHIRQWELHGSLDGLGFFELDKQVTDELNGWSKQQSFPVKLDKPPRLKALKLVMTGPNQKRANTLVFSGIEFFGILYAMIPET